MKDTILWLQLNERNVSDGKDLYSSITDLNQWIKRNSGLKLGERARLYFQLLVEVNDLDLPVHERLLFLERMHSPILNIISKLSIKYSGSGLPLAGDKIKFVEMVNTFWSEMAKGHKIIIDDLSESHFFTPFFKQKEKQQDLTCALYSVIYYLNAQLYSNYMLYSCCSDNVWRDIHQVYRFASKRNLINKIINRQFLNEKNAEKLELTIDDLYKKVLLFSLANPYHLSVSEMELLWEALNLWSKYTEVNINTAKVLEREYPFIIKPYSDQAPFSNYNHHNSGKIADLDLPDFNSDSVWGLETKKLIAHLETKNHSTEASAYFFERLFRAWMGTNIRKLSRKELIEPVVIAIGVSCISQFLSQIDISPKILKLEEEKNNTLEPTSSVYSFYQAYLVDESPQGSRLKINHHSEKSIFPDMGEVIAIKHADDNVQIGYLRWMRETQEGNIELGIEHLSIMAEPVQLSKSSYTQQNKSLAGQDEIENSSVLDSFVFPGGKEHRYQPILFTHTFIEKFYNTRTDYLKLTHKTGSINIRLTQKVNEVLDYSLYLFEKAETMQLTSEEKKIKAAQFEKMWDKI